VWHFADRNPFHYVLSRVMKRFVDSPPPAADASDPFRFATPGKLRDVLAEGRCDDSVQRILQFKIEATLSMEDFWTLRSEMSTLFVERLPSYRKSRRVK